jgi:hypothetical protein
VPARSVAGPAAVREDWWLTVRSGIDAAMAIRCALAGAVTTVAVGAALGNPGTVDAAREADHPTLGLTLAEFANWDVADLPGDAIGAVALRLGLTLVAVALLCALVGRSRSRAAAFVGGWGALVVAAAVAGAATYAYQVAVVLDGRTLDPSYLGGLARAANNGAIFGLWTGWLVGLAVALAVRTEPAVAHRPATHAPARAVPPPGRGIAEPPPPWWAPTRVDGNGAVVQPGPTVFPPGGLPRSPVVAGLDSSDATPDAADAAMGPLTPAPAEARRPASDATREMTTVSGDPHPSDPDATQAVAMPITGGGSAEPDPDATATLDTPGADDTRPIPRHAD